MTPSAYSRPFVAGAIFAILVLFSPVLDAQTATVPQSVNSLPPSEERWALVIGVNKYDDASLNPLYGQNDAKKIASDLADYAGFDRDQIFLLADDQPEDHQPKRERILFWLSDLKQHASPQGLLLVFFSGHGIESENESFLMPKDAHYDPDPNYLRENAIPVKVISDSLRQSQAKQIIVLMDACRNNPYAAAGLNSNKMTPTFANSFDYEKQNLGIRAYATILSTSLGQESFQYQSEKMGYFSWVLDQALKGAYDSGPLTLENLITYLQEKVPKLVSIYNPGREQKPDLNLGGYLANQLVLVGGNRPPPPSDSATPALPPLTKPEMATKGDSVVSVCQFFGEAYTGQEPFKKDESCIIPDIDHLDRSYHQGNFVSGGGGGSSPATASDVPAGIEIKTYGFHAWSVARPMLVSDKFGITTWCKPSGNTDPGCKINTEVIAHYNLGQLPRKGAQPNPPARSGIMAGLDRSTLRRALTLGWDLGRYEFAYGSTIPEAKAMQPSLEAEIKNLLASDGYPESITGLTFTQLISQVLTYYETTSIEKHAAILIGNSAMRVTLIGASKDQATNEAMKKVALASLNGIDPTILRHKQEFFDVLLQRKPHSIAELVEVVDSYAD